MTRGDVLAEFWERTDSLSAMADEIVRLRAAIDRVRALSFDEYRAKGERLAWWSKGYNAAITDALRALDGDT